MMKNRIRKYLSSKAISSYTELDRVFEKYLSGEIQKTLSRYEGLEIYPSFSEKDKSLQIVYKFNNIHATIDFFEEKYDFAVYHAGIDAEELEKSFVKNHYSEDFSFDKIVGEIDQKIKEHPKLKDVSSSKKRAKIYSILAWVSILVPLLVFGGIGLYCIITQSAVKLSMWWVIIFIVIPMILWFVFDVKSKRG